MPTYDYVCKACGHAFEHFQGVHDKQLRTCPECKRRGLQRLIGAGAGVVFKGSGFYETDYKRAGRKDGEAKGGNTDGKAEGKADGKAGGKEKGTSDSAGKAEGGGKPAKADTPPGTKKG